MRRFLATARLCMKEKMYFGVGFLLGQYALRLATLFALTMIWRALAGQGADMQGMTLSQLVSYTVLSSALEPVLNVRTPASSWLHDGTILGLYQRPAQVIGQLTAHTVGGWVMPVMMYSIPVLVVSSLLGVPLRPATNWFYLSFPLAVLQGFAVDYLFACLLIRMRNVEWAVHSLREALNTLLTGALIPFAVLPWGMGRWLSLSPLGTLAGAPLALFTGLDDPLRIVTAQIFWTAVLWPMALYFFGRSRERMVSYGG